MTFPDKLAFHEHKITVKIRSHEVMRTSYTRHRDQRTAGFTIYYMCFLPNYIKKRYRKKTKRINLMLSVTESTNRSNIVDTTLYSL